MSRFQRSIKIALDKISGELIAAEDVFSSAIDAFDVRKKYNSDQIELYCYECGEALNVSGSKYDRLHFKHQPNSPDCILKELSPRDIEGFTQHLQFKESERHKTLKNLIATKLSLVDGVDASTIAVDNRFIIRGTEKRRPDVYCKYFDKELVFEIQLSNLSQRYILNRYNFYKKNGMYLIWILDNFDIHGQSQLERDIKYLTDYQNFFRLDETSNNFQLHCDYKFPFITHDNKVLTKWLSKSISMDEINFDTSNFQVYYYDFTNKKLKVEEKHRQLVEKLKKEELERLAAERLSQAKETIREIIDRIKFVKENHTYNFKSIDDRIKVLDEFTLNELNAQLSLRKRTRENKPIVNYWINSATSLEDEFLKFILGCPEIDLDVNCLDADGTSCFQEVLLNKSIYKETLIIRLFQRGYKMNDKDKILAEEKVKTKTLGDYALYLYSMAEQISDKNLIPDLFSHEKLIFILESILHKKIIGFKYKEDEWIAFANNAIQYRAEYWEYIELALKQNGLWDKIIESDKRGTFQKKLHYLYSNFPIQKYDIEDLIQELYPSLSDNERLGVTDNFSIA